jgi:hypothetical protein
VSSSGGGGGGLTWPLVLALGGLLAVRGVRTRFTRTCK